MKARGDDAEWPLTSYKCGQQEDGNSCGAFALMVRLVGGEGFLYWARV